MNDRSTFIMKYLLITFTLLSICTSLHAQKPLPDSVAKSNAEKQALTMANYLLAKDYKHFTAFTYPAIVKMAGGADQMAQFIEKSINDMAKEGFTFSNVEVRDYSRIIHTEKQLQCTLTEVIELKNPDGKLIQKSTLIGISGDKGANWTFIDTHGAPLKKLQQTLKELSNELVIPAMEKPVLIAN